MNSDCILIMGSNAAECHPVGFQWVVEAQRRGAKVERGEREVLDWHTSSIGTGRSPRIRDITSIRVRQAAPG